MQNNKTWPLSYTIHKVNSKWIGCEYEALKLLEENTGGSKLLDIDNNLF